jgi:hypothetical protein
MKNKTLLFSALLLCFLAFFNGCKKYEDGPLLSLKFKNARIAGEWVLNEYSYVRTTDEDTTTLTFDGSIMYFFGKAYNGWDYVDTSYSYSYSMSLTIDKNGTYKWYEVENGQISKWEALWSWLDGASGKEMLLLANDGIFAIKRLTDKELIITESSYDADGTFFRITESQWIFEKK